MSSQGAAVKASAENTTLTPDAATSHDAALGNDVEGARVSQSDDKDADEINASENSSGSTDESAREMISSVDSHKEDATEAAAANGATDVNEPRDDTGHVESEEEDGHDDAASATSNAGIDRAESLRRKRDREGSLEPSLSQKSQTTDALPAKKNRLHGEQASDKPKKAQEQAAEPRTSFEGEKVGHIRKRVQDLSWKQRKEGERDDGQDDDIAEEPEGQKEKTAAAEEESADATPRKTSPLIKKQATFASFSSKSSGFAAAPNDAGSVFDTAPPPAREGPTASPTASSPPSGAMRKQPTFSSFSSSSSPFNTASASIAGPSWLAGKPSASGGLKPSALGSMGSSSERENNSSSPNRASKEPSASLSASGSKPLGFGAFAANKAFASGSTAAGSRDSTPLSDKGSAAATSEDGAGNPNSFDEALRKQNNASHDTATEETKPAPLAERGQADLRTGEEDEQTIASVRAKLFTMAEDKSWKERGTGTVRCNVAKGTKSSGARLVMRAEGVLRLILNVNLFHGMGFKLEQDKFIRLVALEDGKTTTFAIKVGNASAASQFFYTVKGAIPAA